MILRRTTAAVLLATALAACGGPRAPLDVGVRQIDTDVLIGPARPTFVALPPLAPAPRPVDFPGFVQPPVIFDPEPPPSPQPCPEADPLAPIVHEATTQATEPPVAATYPFGVRGRVTRDGVTTPVSFVSTRIIRNVVSAAPGGGFTFDVEIPQAMGAKTTTTYHVYPEGSTPADSTTPGIYIERVVTTQPNEEPRSFTPTPALLLMQFPAAVGTTWSTRGVDAFTGTVQGFTGTIRSKQVVDACGTRLDSWRVEITEGSDQTALSSFTFGGSVFIAPQYGGIVIADDLERQGTEGEEITGPESRLHTRLASRIRSAPQVPE